jgi:hypothetical protein
VYIPIKKGISLPTWQLFLVPSSNPFKYWLSEIGNVAWHLLRHLRLVLAGQSTKNQVLATNTAVVASVVSWREHF